MSGTMNGNPLLNSCAEVAPLLVFYACDEVEQYEREQIDAHLAICEACRSLLGEESELQTAFSTVSQPADEMDPTGALLAQCRSELSEKLDDLEMPKVREHWMPFGWVQRWMALRPAWSAAGLIIFGVTIGTQVMPWLAVRGGGDDRGAAQAMNVMAAPRLTDEDLSKMAVAGITFAPAPDAAPGTLQLQVRTEQPLMVVGSVDNEDVRRVLTYVVANGERFDPGTRLDCLDALRVRTNDEHVRKALVKAARTDKNPAVRLKALDALRDYTHEAPVRDALLDALHHDANPGVRVEAVNLLVVSLDGNESISGEDSLPLVAAPSPNAEIAPINGDGEDVGRVVRALEDLQRRDPNRYVRLRSAAALRQIGSRDMQ
ncbi:MAG: HEAT repeat domain-containing protein [Acidobacteria bacterium]|nr:HEAT repeat domain-containing protein [Acidobacteriota bacterium]